jgi:DNA-binding NtrC family response regulator
LTQQNQTILHVGSRELIIQLRDRILRLHGFEVMSTLSVDEALGIFQQRPFELVVVDVEGQGRVAHAEKLCADIRTLSPGQKVAFVCNYMVSIESDCPDDIIEAEFDPEAFVVGIKRLIESA